MISERNPYCCEMMKVFTTFNCDLHKDKYECPDTLIDHNTKSEYYSIIIHDGGTSGIEINFCPWCGTKL
ncbi:DUF6980 family protein [Muricauda sp. MAR_2010_75]|jgi:hypothetical protein|uniref:DUF6980 family protein n=1 Tax=Allomuricauda sp. MAR_2010_75 TaxID=1250232 RepID=UPI0009DE33BE